MNLSGTVAHLSRFFEVFLRMTRWNLRRPLRSELPPGLEAAYRRRRLRRFRAQLVAAVNLALTVLVLARLLAWAFPGVPYRFPAPAFYGVLAGELGLLLASRSTERLRLVQGLCFAAILLPWLLVLGTEGSDKGLSLFVLFVLSLLFPWSGGETLFVATVATALHALATRGAAAPERFDEMALFFFAVVVAVTLQFARERDRRIAFALETERDEAERELRASLAAAAEVHRALLTDRLTAPGVALAVHYEPILHLGGDYAKAACGRDGIVRIVVADVTGHGVPAALFVNRLNARIENLLDERRPPERALEALREYAARHVAADGLLMTALWGEIRPPRGGFLPAPGRFVWANHGHPPPILLRPGDAGPRVLAAGATTPVARDLPFRSVTASVEVRRGDWIVLYSDGVLDRPVHPPRQTPRAFAADLWELLAADAPDDPEAFLEAFRRRDAARSAGSARDDVLLVAVRIG